MADAEYIEITNSDVSQARNDLSTAAVTTESPEEINDSHAAEERSSEMEIANDDITNRSDELMKGEDDTTLSEVANRPEEDITADGKDDTTLGATLTLDADILESDPTQNVQTDVEDVASYEVIDGVEEEQASLEDKSEPKQERQQMDVNEGKLDEKPSPFRRFRSFTKPDKKEDKSAGSSINLPSIFSTPFMSLKNIGKRKESNSDEQAPVMDDQTPSPGNMTNVEQLRIERKNLLGMAKLSIKGLIESSLSAGHTLDSDHTPLQQFFVIMESVLKHGLKSPKLFFAGNKQFWGPLEAIEKIASDASEITNSVRDLPGIKTHAGKARAWLRLALMQKRLADYFRLMVDNKEVMREYYEPEAMVLSEEGVVLAGHLVGLNCIDANLCMKGDDLDNQNAAIDYSLYIKDGNRSIEALASPGEAREEEEKEEEKSESAEEKMRELVNQKNYLEERNRYLETTLGELQKKVGCTSSSNQVLETELEAAKISLSSLKDERESWLEERQGMTESHKKILKDKQADLDLERDTLVQSRAGLDEMLNQVKKQLKQEALLRMDVERELELQISMKQEMEVAMKLLEKDIYDKQDSLVTLREQLESVKVLNIEIYRKLQDKTDAVESKTHAIAELEDETKRLDTEIKKLKENLSIVFDSIEKRIPE